VEQLLRNRIHHGKKNGVYVYMNGLGALEGNDIFDNKMDGISVKVRRSTRYRSMGVTSSNSQVVQ